jgi:hypothetical protein
VCSSPNLPGIAWASSYDQSTDFPAVIRCEPLDTPLPGFSQFKSWATFWKLLRLIEGL